MISIYFIQQAQSRAVKCGSSADVPSRLASLQCANPEPLVLLGTFHGSRKYEAQLHQILAPLRIKGEWFRNGPWVDSVIEAFDQGADVDYLTAMLVREAPFFRSVF